MRLLAAVMSLLSAVDAATTCVNKHTRMGGMPRYVTTSQANGTTCESARWCLVITVEAPELKTVTARCLSKSDKQINCDAHITNGLRWTNLDGDKQVCPPDKCSHRTELQTEYYCCSYSQCNATPYPVGVFKEDDMPTMAAASGVSMASTLLPLVTMAMAFMCVLL